MLQLATFNASALKDADPPKRLNSEVDLGPLFQLFNAQLGVLGRDGTYLVVITIVMVSLISIFNICYDTRSSLASAVKSTIVLVRTGKPSG